LAFFRRAAAFAHFLNNWPGTSHALVPFEKRFVYILRNQTTLTRYYTGLTSNVGARLAAHNAGRCPHTARGRPWAIDVVIEFSNETRAIAFERYMKSTTDNAPCPQTP
jgi:putative endonuclease